MVRDDDSPESRKKREQFQAFRVGWKHAVNNRAKDLRYITHPTRDDLTDQYVRGYQAARDAVAVAFMGEAERLGYDPHMDILRSDPEKETPSGSEAGR